MEFKALVSSEIDKKFISEVKTRKIEDLPEGKVLIKVNFSSLNYKDALSANGNKGVSRYYPHTPGIDAAGIVEFSEVDRCQKGDEVIVTGYDLGMNTSGGFSQFIRVPEEWVVLKPAEISLSESMALGTAGLTAGLCVRKLLNHGIKPEMGKVFVTGATGGVGSMAVAIFSKAGYDVVASTGKSEEYEYLKKLGAVRCEGREYCNDEKKRPISRSKWAGGLDTVGGNTLATLMAGCGKNGSIGVCGLVESPKLETTVYPFLLNGVNLIGVESAETPMETRLIIWDKLSTIWKPDNLEDMAIDTTLDQLDGYVVKILAGKTRGRVVVKHQH